MTLFNFFLPKIIELLIILATVFIARYFINRLSDKSPVHRLEIGMAVAFIGLAVLMLNADLSVPLTGALTNYMEIAKTTEVDNADKILQILKVQSMEITKTTSALRTLTSSLMMWCVALAYITRFAIKD